MSGLGLESALSALRAASRGLEVTGQNLAGADVDGYVRRRVETTTVAHAAGVGRLWSTIGPTDGNGVSTSVNRLADTILAARSRVEAGRAATATGVAATYTRLEQVFDEPTDTGIAASLDGLWSAFGSAAAASGSGDVVVAKAGAVVDRIRAASAALDGTAADTRAGLTADLASATDLASRIGTLNQAIVAASGSTSDTADLLDQRDRALDQLAALVGATATRAADGSVTVTVGDATLVTGAQAATLAVADDGTVTADGAPVGLTGGRAAAAVTTLTTTLPAYRQRLDAVATSVRDTVNGALQAGYTAAGNAGGPLFTGTGAADLALSGATGSDLGLYGAAGTTDPTVAAALAATGTRTDGPDATYRSMVSTLGAESSRAAGQADALQAASAAVDADRIASEGVNTDEELTAMLSYQRAYQAASRVLTTVDESLDQLINRTGRVGL